MAATSMCLSSSLLVVTLRVATGSSSGPSISLLPPSSTSSMSPSLLLVKFKLLSIPKLLPVVKGDGWFEVAFRNASELGSRRTLRLVLLRALLGNWRKAGTYDTFFSPCNPADNDNKSVSHADIC